MNFEVLKQSHVKRNIVIGVVVVAAIATIVLQFTRAKYRTAESMPLINGTVNYSLADLNAVAVYIQDESATDGYAKADTIPTSGYAFNEEMSYCAIDGEEDASITLSYDMDTQTLNVAPLTTKGTKCYLYFDEASGATDIIEGLYPDNQNMLAYDDYNNLRYIGADPNNYVSFNGELWRIIGIFNEDTHGVTGEKLIKIIRNESIGNYSWDNKASGTGSSTSRYGSNDWTDSALQLVLNEGAYWNRTSGTCPSGRNGATTNCDFSSTGLTDEAKNMIETVTWKLGGTANYTSASNGLASHFYGYERGTTVYSGRPTTWSGKVALMYPSDYGYATSGGNTTDRTACLATALYNWGSSSFSDCKNNDWLYNSSVAQWTLTPRSSTSSSVFNVYSNGTVSSYNTYFGFGARPSVYLKSTIAISGGTGSSTDPYILEM